MAPEAAATESSKSTTSTPAALKDTTATSSPAKKTTKKTATKRNAPDGELVPTVPVAKPQSTTDYDFDTGPGSNNALQAQLDLALVYHEMGDEEEAQALFKKLARGNDPKIAEEAQRLLNT